jgi:hypothetical protein
VDVAARHPGDAPGKPIASDFFVRWRHRESPIGVSYTY